MKKLTLVLTLLTAFNAKADDVAYLDAPYKDIIPPINDVKESSNKNLKAKNDILNVVSLMTPVKSQGSRGTCSIFSAIAMAEAMLVKQGHFGTDVDLSEEYLEFLNIAPYKRTTDGSYSSKNFNLIFKHGVPFERTLPYVTANWEKNYGFGLQAERCSHLSGNDLKACNLGHFDPNLYHMSDADLINLNASYVDEYMDAKREALENRYSFLKPTTKSYRVSSVSMIKKYLNAGYPLTLGAEFFYGAWNHRKADEYGIGRNHNHWNQGIVGFPEYGSVDYKKSKENRAGHSILIVGYDDQKVVETEVLMQDGTYKKFTYKGVYYFKNSWGTDGFGRSISIEGKSLPGYGMITQKYAHSYGSFYRFLIK